MSPVTNRVLFVDLLPVDGKALGKMEFAIDRQQCADVTDGIAAAIGGDIALAAQRRPENHGRGRDDGGLADCLRHVRADDREMRGDLLSDACRNLAPSASVTCKKMTANWYAPAPGFHCRGSRRSDALCHSLDRALQALSTVGSTTSSLRNEHFRP